MSILNKNIDDIDMKELYGWVLTIGWFGFNAYMFLAGLICGDFLVSLIFALAINVVLFVFMALLWPLFRFTEELFGGPICFLIGILYLIAIYMMFTTLHVQEFDKMRSLPHWSPNCVTYSTDKVE